MNNSISVVVPTYNEEKNIEPLVKEIDKALKSNYEIIFIDDGSKDNTWSKVRNAFMDVPGVKVYTKQNGGKASALNAGIEKADSEFVVCIDADTQLKEDAVSRLMKKFEPGAPSNRSSSPTWQRSSTAAMTSTWAASSRPQLGRPPAPLPDSLPLSAKAEASVLAPP